MSFLLITPPLAATFTSGQPMVHGSRVIKEAKRLVLQNWKQDGLEIQIDVLKGLEDVIDLNMSSQWNIEWNNSQPFSGLLSLPVIFTNEGHVIKKMNVVLKTRIYKNALVSMKTIDRHEILTAESFELARVECTNEIDDYVTDLKLLENKRATRRLSSSMPLLKTFMEDEPLIKKGEKVSVVHQQGPIQIVMSGIARTDGRVGEEIRFMNLHSGRVMTALVHEDRTLELANNGVRE